MLLSDIFSIPFLICLAICILLIGCSSIYFYQRIMQQDHKIASMVSLISSMAEEPSVPIACARPSTTITQHVPPSQQLIAVSDDEESDSSSSEDDSSSDAYDDNSDYSETSSENEDEHILSVVDFDELPTDLENSETIVNEELNEVNELNEQHELETTKSIHLEPENNITDFSIFKSINILESPENANEEMSYKKMPLQKLREIAQQNGHADVSKLKKHELLKLLEAE